MNKILTVLLIIIAVSYAAYKIYLSPKFSNGADIPEFSAPLLNGEIFKMSDTKGNYVLLDFWGSWCGPCRRDNPNLVAIANYYKDKEFEGSAKFEIVSVAIETNEKSWKKAIEKDGLFWKYHILQKDRFKSEIPMLYGVREIPTKYLLNTEGKIIAVNPDNAQIKKLLDGNLSKD